MLGGLEQMVLLAVLHLGERAYAVNVRSELEDRASRRISRGALYTVLERLEGKGYVSSRMGDPTPERGGRAKRYYRVTASGVRALRESKKTIESLWQGLESVLGESG